VSVLTLLVTLLFMPLMAVVVDRRGRYPRVDVVGQMFGFWKVLSELPKQRGVPRKVRCLCTGCNTRKLVKKNHLLSGETFSCGCQNVRDLTNLRVGRLRIQERAPKPAPGMAGAFWRAICDCGGTIVGRGADFVRKKNPVRSCGECGMRQRNAVRERTEPTVRCEAYREGIYAHRRVMPGEVIDVRVSSFCSSWLRRVPPATPPTRTPPPPSEREPVERERLVPCIAWKAGVYGRRRVAAGELVDVKESDFSSSWLRRMPPETPTTEEIEDEEPETPYLARRRH